MSMKDPFQDKENNAAQENTEDKPQTPYSVSELKPEAGASLSEEKKEKPGVKRIVVPLVFFAVVLIIGAVGIVFVSTGKSKKQIDVSSSSNSATPADSENTQYTQAAKIANVANVANTNSNPAVQPSPSVNANLQPGGNYNGNLPPLIYTADQTNGANSNPQNSANPNMPKKSAESSGASVGGAVTGAARNAATVGGETGGTNSNRTNLPVMGAENSIRQTGAAGYFFVSENKTSKLASGENRPVYGSVIKNVATAPPFASVIPFRLLGAIHSLNNKGYARMETTRIVRFQNGFTLPNKTQFIGKLSGAADKRMFISVIGYINSDGKLVKLEGDALDTEQSIGLVGRKYHLSSFYRRNLSPIVKAAKDFALTYLSSRRNGNTVYLPNSVENIYNQTAANQSADTFIVVESGATGYIFCSNLPEEAKNQTDFDPNQIAPELTPEQIRALTTDNGNSPIDLTNIAKGN